MTNENEPVKDTNGQLFRQWFDDNIGWGSYEKQMAFVACRDELDRLENNEPSSNPLQLNNEPVRKQEAIKWSNRYSDTLENDKQGRWAIVGYAGNFQQPFVDSKVARFEVAWIKKLTDPTTNEFLNKFIVHPEFPYKGDLLFDDIDSAKQAIESHLKWFMSCCDHSGKVLSEEESRANFYKVVGMVGNWLTLDSKLAYEMYDEFKKAGFTIIKNK